MFRVGAVLSGLVVLGWIVLAFGIAHPGDSWTGLAELFLALYALAALGLIWCVIGFVKLMLSSTRAAKAVMADPAAASDRSPQPS